MRETSLLANRFVEIPGASVFDLATGERCVLTIATAGGASEQARWAVRCDTLRTWRHPSIARLVDFGAIGDGQRFEAWACGAPWRGHPHAAEQARGAAGRFLRSCGLAAGELAPASMRTSPFGPVLLPSAEAGYHDATVSPDEIAHGGAADTCAIAIIDRPAVSAIAEIFEPAAGSRPCLVSLWGPRGAGMSTALGEIARAARLSGLVPISIDLLASPLAANLSSRTLLVINDNRRGGEWEALLHRVLQSPKPHVLVSAGLEEIPGANGISLNPVSTEALVASVRPSNLIPALTDRVHRAAERSQGRPGRFALFLWGRAERSNDSFERGSVWSGLPRAAEQAPVYGFDEEQPAPAEPLVLTGRWPVPGEIAALRRRMNAAMRMLAAGRHAPGDRSLRETIAGLARRGDWSHAVEGAEALAASLLTRGRAIAAHAVLDDARSYCGRGATDEKLPAIATLAGHAWLDLGRLDEAERVLATAVAAAKGREDVVQLADASLALARCLFWRGRYVDADAALAALPAQLPDLTVVRIAIAVSRHAVGRRDLARAVSAAAEAIHRSQALRDVGLQAAAACAAAFAHLAVNDLDAVEREVASCVADARAARHPLRAIRARVLLAEAERRRQRGSRASGTLNRFARLSADTLPPIVAARCRMLRDLAKPDAVPRAVVDRHMKASGLAALALWAPDACGVDERRTAGLDTVVDGLLSILHACQNADEETTLLNAVCVRVRRELRAAAVAFVAADPSAAGASVIAADGGRVDAATARRAMEAGAVIAPHRIEDRIEAAAPVRYGGATIAGLLARWTLATTHLLSGAAAVLTVASTAAAPAVAAAVARRRVLPAHGASELIGVSAAMADVRRAVERAAAAPFCVLIEGESGCGKELVARAVHRYGPRRDRPFCTLNCAALPDDLVESELFGHARGAFTGAVGERSGVFEEAHGGTLFLDEIGELSMRAQAKVLRVIQEGELRRVGENVSRRVDVRILSATNRDLRQEAAAGRFRLDLLYRLDVLRIAIPPLRERREDVAGLVERFWSDATRRVGSHAALSTGTVAALARYDWPGNVRELQNVLAALAVRTAKRGVVPPSALPPQFGANRSCDTWRLDEARRTFEAGFVRAALVRTGGHRSRAATELGVTRQGLSKLMSRLGIVDDDLDRLESAAAGAGANAARGTTADG